MNKRREIKVVTAVGESKAEEVDEGLSQGTLESGPLSAASTDSGLTTFFKESTQEIYYNNEVRLQGMAYQDDILRASKNVEDARAGIAKLEAMAESKLLTFNGKKSSLILVGNKKKREEIEKELNSNPILLYGKPMGIKEMDKYLGDQVHNGTKESILSTIKKRKGNTLMAINDIAAIVSDARADAIGGMVTAMDIWELSVIPFLLNNAGTWIGLDGKTLLILDDIQKKFLQRILKVKTASLKVRSSDDGEPDNEEKTVVDAPHNETRLKLTREESAMAKKSLLKNAVR